MDKRLKITAGIAMAVGIIIVAVMTFSFIVNVVMNDAAADYEQPSDEYVTLTVEDVRE
ncbi:MULTISPECIES: hypothetical protein [Alkalibacterium]|uniref:Uncharacterized protein n=2 Tax=Alkalibacterium TaxID=99906 RepID=A0A1H7INA8_9LACT|nr:MULTISPECIES: hypothetical protein [Alkalibacterium]GEN50151.1 hypothetical protein APE02nite_08160 [Alkalibacterium pelagium]SDK60479.1 hypothetical protein SAMN04488098_104210 [Alkalibacterium thalassium]SEK63794.1 hypothetical protein SAMN04488099_104199 [Alkalibacterium pelagium]